MHVGGLTADMVTRWVAGYLRWNTHDTDQLVTNHRHWSTAAVIENDNKLQQAEDFFHTVRTLVLTL